MDKNETHRNDSDVLSPIVGARLTSVQFVLDYLILGFDQKGALTTLVWPEIVSAAASIRFGVDSYRNQLCSFIEQRVSAVQISDEETIVISFGDNSFRIPLRQRKLPGERAIFTAPGHFLHVW